MPTCLELATDYVDMKWKGLSAKFRETTVYALASVVAALVREDAKAPSEAALRRVLQGWHLEPSKRTPATADVEDAESPDDQTKSPATPA